MSDDTIEKNPALVGLQMKKLEAEIAKIKIDTETASIALQLENISLAEAQRQEGWEMAAAEENMIYTFADSVSHTSAALAIHTLNHWSRRHPGRDLTIVFSSPGGSAIDGLAFFDFIKELQDRGHFVTTEAYGWVASMGGVLFQAGDKRVMRKNAFLLIHEVSSVAFGTTSQMEDDLKFTKEIQDKILAILAERSTLSSTQIRNRWKRKDWWLDSDKTLELGFADEVK